MPSPTAPPCPGRRANACARNLTQLTVVVGNLSPVKGHLHFLRAVAMLPKNVRGGAARGDRRRGGEEESLRAFAGAPGIGDRVHSLGLRDDIMPAFRNDLRASVSLRGSTPVAPRGDARACPSSRPKWEKSSRPGVRSGGLARAARRGRRSGRCSVRHPHRCASGAGDRYTRGAYGARALEHRTDGRQVSYPLHLPEVISLPWLPGDSPWVRHLSSE